jgi:hypothetical protein
MELVARAFAQDLAHPLARALGHPFARPFARPLTRRLARWFASAVSPLSPRRDAGQDPKGDTRDGAARDIGSLLMAGPGSTLLMALPGSSLLIDPPGSAWDKGNR